MRRIALIAAACLALTGCEADVSSPGAVERRALLAPDFLAAAAANATHDTQAKWLLHQPKEVRASFIREVLDRGGDERLAEIWMLRQSEAVRESYVREVLEPALPPELGGGSAPDGR